MSLLNAQLMVAPTGYTVTAGTAIAFSSFGQIGQNGYRLGVAADTDSRTRRTIETKVTLPRPDVTKPNGYTQCRNSATFKRPIILANGKVTVNTVQIIMAYDVETSDVEKNMLIDIGGQMLIDADFTSFWKAQAQS